MIMAVMATMAWQGVDGIVRARDASQAALEQALRLNTVLAQWEQDLAAIQDSRTCRRSASTAPTLRLTRRSAAAALQLVVWSLRERQLAALAPGRRARAHELQEDWLRSQQLNGSEPQQLRALTGRGAVAGLLLPRQRLEQRAVERRRDQAPCRRAGLGRGRRAGAGGASRAPRTCCRAACASCSSFADGSGFSGGLTRDIRLGPQVQ